MAQHFRRPALYDLAWSAPPANLAPWFGMSDVALAKICKQHGIAAIQYLNAKLANSEIHEDEDNQND